MKKHFPWKSRKAGLLPGSLEDAYGETMGKEVDIEILHYTADHFEEKRTDSLPSCYHYKDKEGITWINVQETHNPKHVEEMGVHFGLHPLLIEDIVFPGHRPKMDDYGEHLFVVMNMLEFNETANEIKSEQVSFVLGKNYVLTFQENGKHGDVFEPNRARIRGNKGRICSSGPDYLLYTLLDTMIDNYFLILEKYSDKIENLESRFITNSDTQYLRELYRIKREMIFLRKSVWPLRELLNKVVHSESSLINDSNTVYYKDIYDHTIQIMDSVESFRDILSGIMDIYLTNTSNKLNAVMKVLTVISTIFMPLSFVVGVYGMNFDNMPELHWKYGYFVTLGICATISSLMVFYFKKKRWL